MIYFWSARAKNGQMADGTYEPDAWIETVDEYKEFSDELFKRLREKFEGSNRWVMTAMNRL